MACTVVIQDVLGQGELGSLATSLKVAGAATGCGEVNVSVACTQQAVTHANVPVASRQWLTVFDRQELKTAGYEECNSPAYPLTVQVRCADAGSDCSDVRVYPEIPCETGCPTIESIDADIPACSEVAGARGYNVTFTAPIVGGNVSACVWSFGDGTDPVVAGSPAEGVAIAQHTYECAGAYPVSLTILSDCEPNYSDSEVLQLELRPCGCPTVSDFEARENDSNRCLWSFAARIGPPFVGCIESYLWNFGDGREERTDVPDVEHVYSDDGPRTVTLTLEGGVAQPGGKPCYVTQEIRVTGCRSATGGNGKRRRWWDPRGWVRRSKPR